MTAMPWAEMAAGWAVFGANILSPGPNVFNTIAIALGVNAAAVVDRSDIANFHLGGLFEKPDDAQG